MARYVVLERGGKDRRWSGLYGDTAAQGAAGCEVRGAAEAALMIDRARKRARRGFGYVPFGSPSGCLDVYRVDPAAPADAFEGDDLEVRVARWGTYEASLVAYNS